MLTGVEILLERMKTNPEEFIEGGLSKWSRVLDTGWSVMTAEEQKALQDGMNEAKREHFNGEVMRVLAQGHDELNLEPYSFKGKPLMEGNRPSKVITSQSMMNQATKLLSDEFDKQYDAYKAKGKPHAKT
jgi:hypothetical protein